MLSVQDLVDKYTNYIDEELYEINSSISDYSEQAKRDLAELKHTDPESYQTYINSWPGSWK